MNKIWPLFSLRKHIVRQIGDGGVILLAATGGSLTPFCLPLTTVSSPFKKMLISVMLQSRRNRHFE